MTRPTILLLLLAFVFSCTTQQENYTLDKQILSHLGKKHKDGFSEMATAFEAQIKEDSINVDAYLGLADAHILLYVFGYVPRDISIQNVKHAYEEAIKLDTVSSNVFKLEGIIKFLDWDWQGSGAAFEQSVKADPKNLNARHWYALWLTAMDRFDDAMAQSDTIMSMDEAGDYQVSRSSFLYFQYRFEEMKPLMIENIKKDPSVPWGYDWLGMAYNGLGEHKEALETYFKAFELSDGTVEVGGGLGHALAHAGETKLAREMADYYDEAAKNNYLPPVQRSFIHLGLEEYDKAIELLQQAYDEQSWFLIFIQVEHWYDPIRKDPRFIEIMEKMKFPA